MEMKKTESSVVDSSRRIYEISFHNSNLELGISKKRRTLVHFLFNIKRFSIRRFKVGSGDFSIICYHPFAQIIIFISILTLTTTKYRSTFNIALILL